MAFSFKHFPIVYATYEECIHSFYSPDLFVIYTGNKDNKVNRVVLQLQLVTVYHVQ